MSNEWKTLRDIYKEGHSLPLMLENMMTQNKIELIGVNESGGIVLCKNSGTKAYVAVEAPHDIGDRWRIYEEPKQPKKWAPALYKLDARSNWILSCAWYSSFSEAASDNYQIFKLIWPAPGFTPVEIPE